MDSNPGLSSAIVVLVVYEKLWADVHAARCLESSLTGSPAPESGVLPRLGRLLVYDNAPQPMGRPDVTLPACEYVHDPSNGGTRAAYLRGLELAQRHGLVWVILLDHDTTLSGDYFWELDRELGEMKSSPGSPGHSVGLLFPRVVRADDGVLSPAVINRWGTVIPFDPARHPGGQGALTAVASGAAIRVDALAAAGAIPPALWLDYLDHWLFQRVQQLGYRAKCLSSTLRHELSVRGASTPGPGRMRNILRAEQVFTRTLGFGARAIYPFRLLARAMKVLPRDWRAARLIVTQLSRPSRADG